MNYSEELVTEILDSIAPKRWDVYIWKDGSGPEGGRLDVADRKRLVELILSVIPEVEEDDDEFGLRPVDPSTLWAGAKIWIKSKDPGSRFLTVAYFVNMDYPPDGLEPRPRAGKPWVQAVLDSTKIMSDTAWFNPDRYTFYSEQAP